MIDSRILAAARRSTNLMRTAQAALLYMKFFEESRLVCIHELGSVEWLQLFASLSILCRVIVELFQAHGNTHAPESLHSFASDTFHYIDVIEQTYSNPYHAERRSSCSVWFCAISSKMKQRILSAQDPKTRKPQVPIGTTMDTLTALTLEAIPNGGFAVAEAGKHKGMDLHSPPDTYMDVNFEPSDSSGVFPFLRWMNSAGSSSDSERSSIG
jgi:hypothetical protein